MARRFQAGGISRWLYTPLSISPPFTVAFWFYPIESWTVLCFYNEVNNDRYQVHYIPGDRVEASAVIGASFVHAAVTNSNSGLQPNAWNFVVAMYDTSAYRRLYVNNVHTNNTTVSSPTSPTHIVLGNRKWVSGDSGSPPFAGTAMGYLSNVTVWRASMWIADATYLWNSGYGVDMSTYRTRDLVAYWPLDEDTLDHHGRFHLRQYGAPTLWVPSKRFPAKLARKRTLYDLEGVR